MDNYHFPKSNFPRIYAKGNNFIYLFILFIKCHTDPFNPSKRKKSLKKKRS